VSPEAWLATAQTQRAVGLWERTATLRSVLLLASANGVGKSALVGRWASALDRRLFCPLVLAHASLSGSGLLAAVTAKLGQPPTYARQASLVLIETALAELDPVVPVIILDDAQSLGYGRLEEGRLLLGLNLAPPPAFALGMIGDEYLLGTLRLRQPRSLYSRIACHYSLTPWNVTQVAQYLQPGLNAVGVTRPAIEPAALNLLTTASGGLARSLCLLARTAWIEAASAGAQNIEPPHVQAAIESVPGAAGLGLPPGAPEPSR
jgi:type II secretory pathway predicted ATPase ExeA